MHRNHRDKRFLTVGSRTLEMRLWNILNTGGVDLRDLGESFVCTVAVVTVCENLEIKCANFWPSICTEALLC